MEAAGAYLGEERGRFHLDPRTKIILTLVISILIFWEHQDMTLISVLAIIPCCLLLLNGQYRTVGLYGGLFALSLILRHLQINMQLSGLATALGGLVVWLVLRMFPSFLLGFYIVESTKTSEFVAAMQKWRVPDCITIPVAVVLRFVPTIREESKSISYAMRMRGIGFGNRSFWKNPGLLLEYRIIPLIMSVAKIGEELSAAALTKGLGKYDRRASVGRIEFGIFDYVVYLTCVALVIWVVNI